ncbi:dehydrogenase [Candidatus Magnetomorum sp. HK-1]|nr:dehydrogenase [Candidatus Magnetomorum sp. HK-1]
MVKHIVIVGAGNIGSRHLQSLSYINCNVKISVIDPNSDSLKISKDRFSIMDYNDKIRSINYAQTFEDINKNIDIAIISTCSNVRKSVIEQLLKKVNVKNMILEKVLFQKIEDYEPIYNLFEQKKINAWVNCIRRMWPFYKKLYEKLKNSNIQEVNVSGSNWGLGSNLIHFIDFIAFIAKKQKYNLKTEFLNKKIIQSNRKSFFEFYGMILGSFEQGPFFSISSHLQGKNSTTIKIVSDSSVIIIDEGNININKGTGRSWISNKNKNWEWEEFFFDIPLQSQTTHLAVQQILLQNECDLTRYSESAEFHIPIISSFLKHIQKYHNGSETVCPIT